MPNTPALIGLGITGMYARVNCNLAQRELTQNLMESAGEVVWLDRESLLDVVTAVSGSGPAYFYYLVECLRNAGTRLGLPAEVAAKLALHTAHGASAMAVQSEADVIELRQRVTTPGGTTEAAMEQFNAGHFEQLDRFSHHGRHPAWAGTSRERCAVMNPTGALIYLLSTLTDLYVTAILLRLLLQWVRADFYNPLSQFLIKVTNPVLVPARRLIPSIGKLDTASVVVMILLELAQLVIIGLLSKIGFRVPVPVAFCNQKVADRTAADLFCTDHCQGHRQLVCKPLNASVDPADLPAHRTGIETDHQATSTTGRCRSLTIVCPDRTAGAFAFAGLVSKRQGNGGGAAGVGSYFRDALVTSLVSLGTWLPTPINPEPRKQSLKVGTAMAPAPTLIWNHNPKLGSGR